MSVSSAAKEGDWVAVIFALKPFTSDVGNWRIKTIFGCVITVHSKDAVNFANKAQRILNFPYAQFAGLPPTNNASAST